MGYVFILSIIVSPLDRSQSLRKQNIPPYDTKMSGTSENFDHAFNALKRRKYIPLTEKRLLLNSISPYHFLDPVIDSYVTIIRNSSERYWNESYTAARLAELWVAYSALPSSRARVPSLRHLKNVMDKVGAALVKWRKDEDELESKATRSSLNYQRLSGREQDTVPFDAGKKDVMPCSVCGHMCVMPIEASEVTNEKNTLLQNAYEVKIRRWNSLPESTRGGKPRKAATSSQLLGCYCFQMDSMLKSSGGHCVNCRDAVAVGGSNLEQDEDGRWRSTCEVCACPCQVTYQRGDRFKIALNLEKEKRRGTTVEDAPENTVSFFHSVINSTLVDASLDAGKTVGSNEEQGDNALAMASTNLLCNPHVQNNVALRNNLQSRMGDRPRMTKGGKTINQVRRAYFDQDNTSTSSSTINSINKRFYNNKLLRNEATSTSSPHRHIDLSTTTPPPNDHPSPTPAPVTASTSTPALVKKTRVRINKRLWKERDTLGKDDIKNLKRAQQRLNRKDEELCTALLDTEPEFKGSIEAVEFCSNYVS